MYIPTRLFGSFWKPQKTESLVIPPCTRILVVVSRLVEKGEASNIQHQELF